MNDEKYKYQNNYLWQQLMFLVALDFGGVSVLLVEKCRLQTSAT
jgi:hypothetical protein